MTIFLCTQLHSDGQSQQNEFRRTSIGITFSPAYCFRSLHYAQSNKWIEDLRNKNEVPIFGYSTGANIKYNLSEKNAIKTGLLFSLNGEQTKYQDLQWQSQGNNYPQEAKAQFHCKYLAIPFEFAHYFGSNQLRFFAAARVSLNVFTQKKTNVISIYNFSFLYFTFNLSLLHVRRSQHHCRNKRRSVSVTASTDQRITGRRAGFNR